MSNSVLFTSLFFFLFILLLKKRNPFDLFFLAFCFIGLYSFPLVLGRLPGNGYIQSQPIDPLLYIFFSLVLSLIFLSSFLYSQTVKPAKLLYGNPPFFSSSPLRKDKIFFYISLSLFTSVLAIYLFTVNPSHTTKGEVIKAAGFKLVLLDSIAIIMTVYSFIRLNRFYRYFSYFCVLLVFSLFGLRSTIVISGLIVVFYTLNRKQSVSIYSSLLYLAYALIAILIVITLKPIYGFILGERSDLMFFLYGVITEGKWYSGVEFLMTQHIFNAVVINDFVTPWWLAPLSLIFISPIPGVAFDVSSSIFNDLFQPFLYPKVPYGMAYNPWAEAYSWGKNLGLALYLIIFLSSIALLQFVIDNQPRSVFLPLFLIVSIITVFYFHRNSMGSYLAYLRNYIYLYTAILILSRSFESLIPRKRSY